MKVLVIGAAGASGQQVVQHALAAGHAVTAFVHDAASHQAPPGVRVLAGDATYAAIERAVVGQEAVMDAIGGSTPYLPFGGEYGQGRYGRHAAARRAPADSHFGGGRR